MKKDYFIKELSALPHGVIDDLRKAVEWIETSLPQQTERSFEFRESVFDEESNLNTAQVVEQMGDAERIGAKVAVKKFKGDWEIVSHAKSGTLKLNYETYKEFKEALKSVLKKQPFGFPKKYAVISKPKTLKVLKESGKVLLKYDEKKKPIYIAEMDDNQGKLLLLLSYPAFGIARKISSVAEELGSRENSRYLSKEKYKTLITNTTKEIQRKLAKNHLRNLLKLKFEGDTVRIEIG